MCIESSLVCDRYSGYCRHEFRANLSKIFLPGTLSYNETFFPVNNDGVFLKETVYVFTFYVVYVVCSFMRRQKYFQGFITKRFVCRLSVLTVLCFIAPVNSWSWSSLSHAMTFGDDILGIIFHTQLKARWGRYEIFLSIFESLLDTSFT